MTLGIANQLKDRKGSTVQFEKPEVHVGEAHEALRKALSNQLEGRDSYYIYMDEDYIESLSLSVRQEVLHHPAKIVKIWDTHTVH